MHRLRKRFVMLVIPVALILFSSLLVAQLVAQGPPGCANLCWQNYTSAVKGCNGDPTCLARAREKALACVQGCGLPPH